jgi:hypothetical protein
LERIDKIWYVGIVLTFGSVIADWLGLVSVSNIGVYGSWLVMFATGFGCMTYGFAGRMKRRVEGVRHGTSRKDQRSIRN